VAETLPKVTLHVQLLTVVSLVVHSSNLYEIYMWCVRHTMHNCFYYETCFPYWDK
jgi:hypothetical protein